jgi:hypothetical protein
MTFIGTRCVSENPDKVEGYHWSSKMKATMPYRNELARDCMRVFDYEMAVTEYRARPFAIEFYQGEERKDSTCVLPGIRELAERS